MMAQPDGYDKARQILKSEFNKRHEIARSHIDSLTTGKQLSANDYDGLVFLVTEMQKCITTLGEIGY